jgi:hypothetical protein
METRYPHVTVKLAAVGNLAIKHMDVSQLFHTQI